MRVFVEVQRMKENKAATFAMFLIPLTIVGAIFAIKSSDKADQGVIPLAISLLVMIVVAAVYFILKLTVSVDKDMLRVKFTPFAGEEIDYADIISAEPVTYRPLRDYGGWGVRYGRGGGRALNVSGNRGVQLVLKGGDRLLIGSLKAEELAAAINARKAERAQNL